MNIDEIKRSLNKRRTNLQAPVTPQNSPTVTVAPPEARTALSPRQGRGQEARTVNEIFTRTLEEEEKEPQSEPWYAPDMSPRGAAGAATSLNLDDVRRTISDLGLDEEEYDWRHQTANGRKSRREFTNFLKISL